MKHLSRMLPEGDESYFKQVQDPQLRKQYRGLPSLRRVVFDLFKEITDVEFHLSFFSIITIIILIIVQVFSFHGALHPRSGPIFRIHNGRASSLTWTLGNIFTLTPSSYIFLRASLIYFFLIREVHLLIPYIYSFKTKVLIRGFYIIFSRFKFLKTIL